MARRPDVAVALVNLPLQVQANIGVNVYSSVPKFLILSMSGGFSMGSGIEIESRALNDNTTTQRPNQVLVDPYAHGFLNYLNPLAFQQPALGTLGNIGTYDVYGPGLFEVDINYALSGGGGPRVVQLAAKFVF